MHLTRRPSRVALGASALLLALALAACAGPPATPSPTPTATPGASETASATPTPTPTPTPVPVSNTIERIAVTGEAGKAPGVSIPTPFAVDQTRTRTLAEGQSGAPQAEADGIVEVNYVGVNARTGQTFDSSWERGQPAMFGLDQVVPGFTKGLTGTRAGQRILVVMPGADGYDASGGSPQAGIEVGDTLVFVVDVIATSVKQATGASASPQVPVTLGDEGGKPTVTIPAGSTPPADLVVAPLVKGVQRPVGAGDYVMVHYRSYSWKTGALIEDKFGTPDAGQISETIEAWKQGVVGQPIGSRVLIVAPPKVGYEKANQNPPIEAGDTVVFVVDILFSSAVS